MSNYVITDYSYNQAKKLNLIIKSSKDKKKKLMFIQLIMSFYTQSAI